METSNTQPYFKKNWIKVKCLTLNSNIFMNKIKFQMKYRSGNKCTSSCKMRCIFSCQSTGLIFHLRKEFLINYLFVHIVNKRNAMLL